MEAHSNSWSDTEADIPKEITVQKVLCFAIEKYRVLQRFLQSVAARDGVLVDA